MHALLPPPSPGESDTLDAIGSSFFATLTRDGNPVFHALAGAVAALFLVLLVRWVRREVRKDRQEQAEGDARHARALSLLPPSDDREWVRVPAHLRVEVKHERGRHGVFYEPCETQNVSAGGLSFLTQFPPPPGTRLWMSLDLGERRPLALSGVVTRTEPSPTASATHLVAVKLGPIDARAREHLVRWVAREETRRIAEAQRGRLCAVCHRPLANSATNTHASCARAGDAQAS
jgi:hypothetical protein